MENRNGRLIDENGGFHPENMRGNDARNDVLFKKFDSADPSTFWSCAVALDGLAMDLVFCRCGDKLDMLGYDFLLDDGHVQSYNGFPRDAVLAIDEAVSDFALDVACEKTGLSKDEFLSKLVDRDVSREAVEKPDMFDKDGTFHPEGMTDVDRYEFWPPNERFARELAFRGPGSIDCLNIAFDDGHAGYDSFEDSLNNAIEAGKLTLREGQSVSAYAYDLLELEREGYGENEDWPNARAYNMDADICLDNGEFKLAGMSVLFVESMTGTFEPEYRCEHCFDLSKFSDSEKKAVVDFALDSICEKSGLSRDEIKDKLVDRSSEYAKLKAASAEQGNDGDEFGGDYGIGDD